jgi:PhnB protein
MLSLYAKLFTPAFRETLQQNNMTTIKVYFNFNGNCREAMTFYHSCLGGELALQTIGESPMADRMPAEMQGLIMHGTITTPGFVIMGSDMVMEGLVRGNSTATLIDCTSEAEVHAKYNALAEGGMATHPLENTFWGAIFGNLTDRFGNPWMLHYLKA